MKNFAQYEHRKKSLLQAYDMVLGGGLLPVEKTGAAEVEQRRKGLEDNRFIVAVCGRIKAGKSTLLNALLFRDWVVPTDDLPLTAKNTLIEYGPTASLEITFYDSDEWRALTQEVRAGDETTSRRFFDEVNLAASHGIKQSDFIHAEALVQRSDRVLELAAFVTPVAKGGIYTPFVKQVRLIHPHPWLRSVTIADTPGVDDPFKFREDQTKKFVTSAGAVLYVTYAGQAMAQQDFDFLNEYLIHVAPQRRVIAVNKADTLELGRDDVSRYLRSLADSDEPAVRAVFGERGSVRLVSALGALIGEATQQGRTLSEDNQYYHGLMAASGHLDAANHGIDALRDLIEERLVSHDGESLVNDHALFLKSLFERGQRLRQRHLSLCRERLRELGQSEQQLQTEIAGIEAQMRLMKKTLDSSEKKLKTRRTELLHNLSLAFDALWEKTAEQVRRDLDQDAHIDGMGIRASWSFNTYFNRQRVAVETALSTCVKDIEAALTDFANELRSTWANWPGAGYLDDVLSYSLYDTLYSLRGRMSDVGSAEQLEKIRYDNTLFFQRWLNLERGRRSAATALVEALRGGMGSAIQTEFGELKLQLEKEIAAQLANLAAQLKEVQESRLLQLSKLLQNKVDRGRERDEVAAELAATESELERLEALHMSVRRVLAA